MTDETLVKRLRMVTGFIRFETGDRIAASACLSEEAADRIELLATTNEQLQQALKDQSSVSDRLAEANEKMKEKFLVVMAERDEAWERAEHAEEQWGRCGVKLATCEKYRDAYDKMGRIGTEAYRDLEAKLAENEVRLGKAEAGLLAIAKRDEQMIWGEDYEVEEAFKDMRDIALATLAAVTETHKIKGESHE